MKHYQEAMQQYEVALNSLREDREASERAVIGELYKQHQNTEYDGLFLPIPNQIRKFDRGMKFKLLPLGYITRDAFEQWARRKDSSFLIWLYGVLDAAYDEATITLREYALSETFGAKYMLADQEVLIRGLELSLEHNKEYGLDVSYCVEIYNNKVLALTFLHAMAFIRDCVESWYGSEALLKLSPYGEWTVIEASNLFWTYERELRGLLA